MSFRYVESTLGSSTSTVLLSIIVYDSISLKSFPCEFPHRLFHHLLIINFLINDLLLSKFPLTCHTDGDISPKIFSQVLTMMSRSLCIISFVTPIRLQKAFDLLFLHLKKSIIIIIAKHAALFVFCISAFILFNIYLGMIILALFLYRINF